MENKKLELEVNVKTGNKDAEGKDILATFKGEKEFVPTVKQMREAYGDEMIVDWFIAHAKAVLNGIIRRMIQAGDDNAKIAEYVASWKPGDTPERRAADPTAVIKAKAASMTPEEKLEYARSLGLL